MPILRVEMWAGAGKEVKAKIAKGLTDVMVDGLNCPVQAVTIIFNDVPKDQWVIGGRLCSDAHRDK